MKQRVPSERAAVGWMGVTPSSFLRSISVGGNLSPLWEDVWKVL